MIGGYYNPFWDKYITIFTKFYDSETKTTKWYKYNVYNCFFSLKNNMNIKVADINIKNEYLARIPYVTNYLKYNDWCSKTDEERQNNISLSIGSLIFNGDIETNISNNASGNDLLEQYKGDSFRVTALKENSSFMIRHYYVEG